MVLVLFLLGLLAGWEYFVLHVWDNLDKQCVTERCHLDGISSAQGGDIGDQRPVGLLQSVSIT